MAPIIEVSEEIMKALNPNKYIHRMDLENKTQQIAELNRSNWIRVSYEFTKGQFQLDVDPARLSYSSAIKEVSKKLGRSLKNTSKDSLHREFIGNINYYDALKLNLLLGNKTLDMNEFAFYGKLLLLGIQGKENAYTTGGKKIDKKILENYFTDIFGIKSPWRGEFFEDIYKFLDKDSNEVGSMNSNGKLYVKTNYILNAHGNPVSTKTELLDKATLMTDKLISSADYLTEDHTSQGHPIKEAKSGDINYWAPRKDNNSVAYSFVDSGRANLSCNGYPSDGGSDLGVRGAFRHKKD